MKKEPRKTNIELLRIIAMIMIITSHFTCHNVVNNQVLSMLTDSVGKAGNIIFLLTTGYFLINSERKVKKVLALWLEIIFYNVIIMVIMKLAYGTSYMTSEILYNLTPISNQTFWFITEYIIIYIFSPFINKFIKSLKQTELYKIILAILILNIFPSIIYTYYNINTNIGNTGMCIVLYMIGAYIGLYGIDFFEKRKIRDIVVVLISGYTLTVISYWIFRIMIPNINPSVSNNSINIYRFFNNSNVSPTILIYAISLFYIFKKMKIKTSKIINYVASITLAIYLIHENPTIKEILWREKFVATNNIKTDILMLIQAQTIIWITTLIIETIRKIVFEKPLMKVKWIDILCSKIDSIL